MEKLQRLKKKWRKDWRFLNLKKENEMVVCIMNWKIAEPVEWAIPAEPRRSTSPERTAELPLDLSESSKRQDRYTDNLCHLT